MATIIPCENALGQVCSNLPEVNMLAWIGAALETARYGLILLPGGISMLVAHDAFQRGAVNQRANGILQLLAPGVVQNRLVSGTVLMLNEQDRIQAAAAGLVVDEEIHHYPVVPWTDAVRIVELRGCCIAALEYLEQFESGWGVTTLEDVMPLVERIRRVLSQERIRHVLSQGA